MLNLANLWDMILTQRAWSWTVIGILYLLVFLMIKGFFFRELLKRARALNSKWYHEIKKVYIKKCIAGWVLFLISFLMVVFFWQSGDFKRPSLYEVGMIFLILMTVLLSVISHLIAFGVSLIHVLKQVENNQMTI